ncbi:MAG TPA: DUF2207 domain-containing protein [Patescibacteria group bacterium]|nr:DUF2207 domain-containing protein [Patescibacteria group bacterium]
MGGLRPSYFGKFKIAGFKIAGLALVLPVLLCFLIVPKAQADTNDFVINDFNADYTLNNKDPQGELRIIERIKVDFSDNNHGILRAIPMTYKKHRLQMKINSIKSDSGAPTQYDTYSQNSNTVIKIGDPNRTVTGNQEYTIDYTLHNVISFYKDHNELYWDINGDQWQQQIDNVVLTLHLPQAAPLPPTKTLCYTGAFGDTTQQCSIFYDENAQSVKAATTATLTPGTTLTIVTGFDKGYFQPSKWYETVNEYTPQIVGFLVPLLLLAVPSFVYWFRRGRDPRGKRTIVPEYDAPDDLKPIEVGTVIDFATDNKDITATIIDLAIRGYIQIVEHQNKKIFGNRPTYSLKLVRSSTVGLNEYEKELLQGIFEGGKLGNEVSLEDLKFKLDKVAAKLRKDVKADLLELGYFQRHPITAKIVVISLIILALWLASFIAVAVIFDETAVLAAVVGTSLGAALACLLLYYSRSRTIKGVATKERILGLQLYLKTAEADRIKMLQSPNARYAEHSKEPAMTVRLFEKLLPYAMVLGVEGQWAKQFKDIYRTPPDWYSGGNWTTFSVIYLTASLSEGMAGAINTAFSAPTNAAGSGIGGGFAGGGGGGGGGGGW